MSEYFDDWQDYQRNDNHIRESRKPTMTQQTKKKFDSIGLWAAAGATGSTYYKHSKPVTINGREYWVNLYTNQKTKDTQPDFNLQLKPVEPRQSEGSEVNNGYAELAF